MAKLQRIGETTKFSCAPSLFPQFVVALGRTQVVNQFLSGNEPCRIFVGWIKIDDAYPYNLQDTRQSREFMTQFSVY